MKLFFYITLFVITSATVDIVSATEIYRYSSAKTPNYEIYIPEPERIWVSRHPNSFLLENSTYELIVRADSSLEIEQALLYYRFDSESYRQLSIDNLNSEYSSITLLSPQRECQVFYYLKAIDNNGDTLYYPRTAPDSIISFSLFNRNNLSSKTSWVGLLREDIVLEGGYFFSPVIALLDVEKQRFVHDINIPERAYKGAVSAGGHYAVAVGISTITTVDLESYEINNIAELSRTDLYPQRILITDNGQTAYENCTISEWGIAEVPLFKINTKNGLVTRISTGKYKVVNELSYNPVDESVYYLCKSSYIDRSAILRYSTSDDSSEVILELSDNNLSAFCLVDNYTKLLTLEINRDLGCYIVKKIQLEELSVIDSIYVADQQLIKILWEEGERTAPQFFDNGNAISFLNTYLNQIVAIDLINSEYGAYYYSLADDIDLQDWVCDGLYDCPQMIFNQNRLKRLEDGGTVYTQEIGILNMDSHTVFNIRPYDYGYIDIASMFSAPPKLISNKFDVNNDNKFDIFDLLSLLKELVSENKKTDLNSDGKLNVFDLLILLEQLVDN